METDAARRTQGRPGPVAEIGRAAAWLVLWVALAFAGADGMPRPGVVGLLLGFGLLFVVPLGLVQVRGMSIRLPWPVTGVAGFLAAVSLLREPGAGAAALAAPWFAVCLVLALWGLTRLAAQPTLDPRSLLPAAALCYLTVGAGWLVVSRLGLRPLGFSDVVVELTAVHFHFAGFAAPLVAAATSAALEGSSARRARLAFAARAGGMGAVVAMPVVAAGFVLSSRLGAVGAVLLAVSLGTVAIAMAAATPVRRGVAGVLLGIAAASVTGAMVLAAGYAVGPLLGFPGLSVVRMAELHGTANALGFCGAGLLGYTLPGRPARLVPVRGVETGRGRRAG